MHEALTVEILAVHDVGRQLAVEGASAEVWRRYRVWRDAVIAAADDHVAEPAGV